MLNIAVIATGEPIPVVAERYGDFASMIRRAAGDPLNVAWIVVDARLGLPSCPPKGLAGIVITGSPSSVTEDAWWMRAAKPYLQSAVVLGIPVLGICFGHQLLAAALGGRVVRNPRGREFGLVQARGCSPDPVLALPSGPFPVAMAHEDSVSELPPRSVVLAATEREPHAAVRFAQSCWGVQFHPEFCAGILNSYMAAELNYGRGAPPASNGCPGGPGVPVQVLRSEYAAPPLLPRFVRFAARCVRSK